MIFRNVTNRLRNQVWTPDLNLRILSLVTCMFGLYVWPLEVDGNWQGVVAYANLATYYIIGLPIGCVLGFKTSLQIAVS